MSVAAFLFLVAAVFVGELLAVVVRALLVDPWVARRTFRQIMQPKEMRQYMDTIDDVSKARNADKPVHLVVMFEGAGTLCEQAIDDVSPNWMALGGKLPAGRTMCVGCWNAVQSSYHEHVRTYADAPLSE